MAERDQPNPSSEKLRQLMLDRIAAPAIDRVIAGITDDQRQEIIEALEQGQIPSFLILALIKKFTELPIGEKSTQASEVRETRETKERLINLKTLGRPLADIFKKVRKDPDANLRTRVRKELEQSRFGELGDVVWVETDQQGVTKMWIESVVSGNAMENFFKKEMGGIIPNGYQLDDEEVWKFKNYCLKRLEARIDAMSAGDSPLIGDPQYAPFVLEELGDRLEKIRKLFKGDVRSNQVNMVEAKLSCLKGELRDKTR